MNRTCSFLVAILHIMNCISVTSRPLESYDAASTKGQVPDFPQALKGSKGFGSIEGEAYENEDTNRGLTRLGSTPPSCEHKCKGCIPCCPIQTPTTGRIGVQYANYEPEEWKCRCGASFFSP